MFSAAFRGRLNIKMPSYHYRDPHGKDKTVSRPSYLKHGNPHTWERRSLYWDGALVPLAYLSCVSCESRHYSHSPFASSASNCRPWRTGSHWLLAIALGSLWINWMARKHKWYEWAHTNISVWHSDMSDENAIMSTKIKILPKHQNE